MECRAQRWRRTNLASRDGPFSRSGVANLVIKDQYPLVKAMKAARGRSARLRPLLGQLRVALATQLRIELRGRARPRHDEEDVSDRAEHACLGQVARAMYA